MPRRDTAGEQSGALSVSREAGRWVRSQWYAVEAGRAERGEECAETEHGCMRCRDA
jgi:hypothetical protein